MNNWAYNEIAALGYFALWFAAPFVTIWLWYFAWLYGEVLAEKAHR